MDPGSLVRSCAVICGVEIFMFRVCIVLSIYEESIIQVWYIGMNESAIDKNVNFLVYCTVILLY